MMDDLAQFDHTPHGVVPRVLTVHGKYQGPNLYRCWWPNGYLATKGFIADFCGYDRFDDQHGMIASGRYNLIVTPRIAFATETAFQQWHDLMTDTGIAWVYDSDDDLWSPEFPERQVRVFENMPGPTLTRQEYELERLQRIFVLKRVDALTVTTPHLGDLAANYTDVPIYEVPNLVNVATFETNLAASRRDVLPLTVGWSGTRRQEDDLEVVAAAWRVIAERYPEVKFVVQGYHSPALASAVPLDRLFIMRGVTVEDYPAMLHNIDIACCAVSASPWNQSKSAIKYFEATLAGAACVVSRALYGPYVRHGRTGFVASTVDEWVTCIGRLIEDELLRRELQRAAREYVVEHHSLERHWPVWIATWSHILDAKRRLRGNSHAPDARAEPRAPASAAAR